MSAELNGPWSEEGGEDVLGQDRLIHALLRMMERLPPGRRVAVHGAPGSGRALFLQRMASLLEADRQRSAALRGVFLPTPAWLDPTLFSTQLSPLLGVATALARVAPNPGAITDRVSDLIAQLNRLSSESPVVGGGVRPGGDPPIVRLRQGFQDLIGVVRGGRTGRVVLLIDRLDRLPPRQRLELIEGLELLLGEADVTVVYSADQDALASALRQREGDLSPERLNRLLGALSDVAIDVPHLGVRRITGLLRRYIGDAEDLLQRSFGKEALNRLSAAAAHEPLGTPLFLRQLANRALLLAEFAQEARGGTQDLSEAQWGWVIISQRWPEIRQQVYSAVRWAELRQALAWMQRVDKNPQEPPPRVPLARRLEDDAVLYRYLRLHAAGFEHDPDGLLWVERLMRAAGL